MDKQYTTDDFYFCYSMQIAKYLRYEKNINFITKAIHPKSNQLFYLFFRDSRLDRALAEHSKTD